MPVDSAQRRVLVVDDDEDSAELLAETFRMAGCQVAVAHDGATALEISESFVPDAALLDLALPDMDGAELAQRLRELMAGHSNLRLIALTGFGGAEVQRKLHEAGFDLHLVKPAHPDTLLRAVGIRDSSTAMLS